MIEIVPEKPVITDELAMSAVKVVSDYCDGKSDCEGCVFRLREICKQFRDCPSDWSI